MYFVRVWEKIYSVLTAPHCIEYSYLDVENLHYLFILPVFDPWYSKQLVMDTVEIDFKFGGQHQAYSNDIPIMWITISAIEFKSDFTNTVINQGLTGWNTQGPISLTIFPL